MCKSIILDVQGNGNKARLVLVLNGKKEAKTALAENEFNKNLSDLTAFFKNNQIPLHQVTINQK